MSTRMLVTECFDGNHAACKGYNGPAGNPNFRCDCDCHSREADGELIEAIAMPWICIEERPCEEATAVHWQEMITALAATFTTIREEARRAAFKESIGITKEAHAQYKNQSSLREAIIAAFETVIALEAAEKGERNG